MVRISDILKYGGNPPESGEPKKDRGEKATGGVDLAKTLSQESQESKEEQPTQITKAMHQIRLSPEELQQIYNQALEVVKEILQKAQSQDASIDLRKADEIVENMVDRITLGDKDIISLIANCTEDNYLYAHLVNVCIISLYLGLGLGYNKSKLNELGKGALLHDIGMTKVMDIIQQPRPLNESEYEEVRKHPIYSSDLLNNIDNIQEGIIQIVKQEHERLNGSGYPEGLKDDQIHEYAKIVAIADIYEALTHPRPHRQAMEPHMAVKELLSMSFAGTLDADKIIKILISEIGIYPVGNWVELNTGEIGKVVSANPDWPLRPKVNVIFSADREMLSQSKSIDLSRSLNIFIKRSINPQELNLKLE